MIIQRAGEKYLLPVSKFLRNVYYFRETDINQKLFVHTSCKRNVYNLHKRFCIHSVKIRLNSSFPPNHPVSLVIFDKDGTLICFHAMWTPWATAVAQSINKDLHHPTVDMTREVYRILGFCPQTKVVSQGLLAEATMGEIKNELSKLIMNFSTSETKARQIVEEACSKQDMSNGHVNVEPLDELLPMFQTLKDSGIKTAVCTADNREQTENTLKRLGLMHYIDMIVCGDDPGTKPKPDPENALKICETLAVPAAETVMIGDTKTDVTFGKSAKLGTTVGVLSGIGKAEDLMGKGADFLLQKVGDIVPLIARHNGSVLGGGRKMNILKRLKFLLRRRFGGWRTTEANVDPLKQRHSKLLPPTTSFDGTQKRFFYHYTQPTAKSLPPDVRPTHVIVGAGSAGCVLANRLTENPDNRVLLVESGPRDTGFWRWKLHMPSALMYNLDTDVYNWYYHTMPQIHMNERVMYWPRGKVWGGSSSLNAMVYIRGHAKDYDRWVTEGATGWSYAECLPYFKKSETYSEGADDYRGDSGPLHVTRMKPTNPLHEAFVEAAVQAGYQRTKDMNGYQQEGFGLMDATIHKGLRWSASRAYLHPILSRKNLFIESNVNVTKLIFNKNRAVGVEIQNIASKPTPHVVDQLRKRIYVEDKVILCAGAINTPQILMLSGVGHPAILQSVEIPVVQNLPGVGQNLQDHLEVYVQYACTKPITLYNKSSWLFPHNMIRIGLEWFLFQSGLGASNHLETGGFCRTKDPPVDQPNLQFHFLPSVVLDHGRKTGNCHAYQVHIGAMRQTSRGWVKLRTADPFHAPLINPNYLSTEYDRLEMRRAVEVARHVLSQKALEPYRGRELSPGPSVTTDQQLDAFVREHGDSAYHPSCTCKMGSSSDPNAVVNPKTLLVFGSENLHIVDASIMPSMVSGNLNGPVIMMAEKAADIIMGKPPLPPVKVPVKVFAADQSCMES